MCVRGWFVIVQLVAALCLISFSTYVNFTFRGWCWPICSSVSGGGVFFGGYTNTHEFV